MSYQDKLKEAKNPAAKLLLETVIRKGTNLCVSLDVTGSEELLALADLLGPEICLLKTHIDTLEDYSDKTIQELLALSEEHGFLIFEDRKFADIGNTVKLQYEKGVYHIVDWAHITNAHIVPGPGVIEGLQEVGLPKGRGLLLLAEMSTAGNLAVGEYTAKAYDWAEQYNDFVIGFIGRGGKDVPAGMLVLTPGVNLETTGDTLGQQYISPEQAVAGGSDVVIVGRGIYAAENPLEQARRYRVAAWSAVI